MNAPPRVLIIDDLYGRRVAGGVNKDRLHLCGQFLLRDVTGDQPETLLVIDHPVAEAVFLRGQQPMQAVPGDVVENDLEGVVEFIRQGWRTPGGPQWSLVLLDLCFHTGPVTAKSHAAKPGMPEGRDDDDTASGYFGLSLLRALHAVLPELPIVILSSQSREEVSLEFSQHGALGFIPRAAEDGPKLLRQYLWRHGLFEDPSRTLVGSAVPLLLALRAARRASLDRKNVLILGERGSGKELIARAIHRYASSENFGEETRQSARPFVAVDSGSLSPTLFASELFGHRRGAFTDARADFPGKIVLADRGELFLDEIANMPGDVQVGLLRVIETREVIAVGASAPKSVDVRFLSATNGDLESGFRQDLLDRLREGGVIHSPPLRERLEDLPALADYLVREAERSVPGALKRRIEPETLDLLRSYSWPGNVRQLRACVAAAVSNFPDVEHLVPAHLRLPTESPQPAQPAPKSREPIRELEELAKFNATALTPPSLLGLWPSAEDAWARFAAGALRAAIDAVKRPSVDHPHGQILIHPALKMLSGDRTLSASRAADLVKKILTLAPLSETLRRQDPVLAEAYEIALRLRPKGSRATAAAKQRAKKV
jgi:DNA-binding NtrC family response regulator